MSLDITPLEHFIRLAQRGNHPGASSGEHRAYALAMAILEHTPGLDADARVGAAEFLDVTVNAYYAAKELIDG